MQCIDRELNHVNLLLNIYVYDCRFGLLSTFFRETSYCKGLRQTHHCSRCMTCSWLLELRHWMKPYTNSFLKALSTWWKREKKEYKTWRWERIVWHSRLCGTHKFTASDFTPHLISVFTNVSVRGIGAKTIHEKLLCANRWRRSHISLVMVEHRYIPYTHMHIWTV